MIRKIGESFWWKDGGMKMEIKTHTNPHTQTQRNPYTHRNAPWYTHPDRCIYRHSDTHRYRNIYIVTYSQITHRYTDKNTDTHTDTHPGREHLQGGKYFFLKNKIGGEDFLEKIRDKLVRIHRSHCNHYFFTGLYIVQQGFQIKSWRLWIISTNLLV